MVCEFTGSCSLSEECSARGDYSQPPCATKAIGTQPTSTNSVRDAIIASLESALSNLDKCEYGDVAADIIVAKQLLHP